MKIALILSALPVSVYAAGSFSYDPASDRPPAAWGSLTDIGGNQCGGSIQSGIDVPESTCDVFEDYGFSAGTCTVDDLVFTLNDHSIRADYDTSGGCQPPRMSVPGKDAQYEALQFHLHTGSDHALHGRYYGSCLHLVHKSLSNDGTFSVLGFLLTPTAPEGSGLFDELLTRWEAVAANTVTTCADLNPGNFTAVKHIGGGGQRKLEAKVLNPYDMVAPDATMYTYDGSLTTPPCSEVVFWNVVDVPFTLSIREFLRLTNLILEYVDPSKCEYASVAAPSGFTGRPVQPINGRTIERICPVGFDEDARRFGRSQESSATALTMTTALAVMAFAVVATMF